MNGEFGLLSFNQPFVAALPLLAPFVACSTNHVPEGKVPTAESPTPVVRLETLSPVKWSSD